MTRMKRLGLDIGTLPYKMARLLFLVHETPGK